MTAGDIREDAEIQRTKRELIEASESPLSVVIVGIGKGDFSQMAFLDEHDPQTEGGRDITKFVRFSDYTRFNLLTEAVLDEIPEQLVDYYFGQGILPGNAEEVDQGAVANLPADQDDRAGNFFE